MPGTSAGLKKAWETRRAKYGESGRSAQTVNKSSKKQGGDKSAHSSRNTNKGQRMNERDLFVDSHLRHMLDEREETLQDIRKFDRDKSRGVYDSPTRRTEYRHDQPPVWAIEQRNKLARQKHSENVRRLRELDDAIRAYRTHLLAQERKKYGRRYN